MLKNTSTKLDYRNLIVNRLRENSLSFSLGLLLFLAVSSYGFTQMLPSMKSMIAKANSDKNGSVKGKRSQTENNVRTYTVKEGDQLFLIAQQFYGSGFNMEDIMKANNLTNPDAIEVGQKLIIPDVKSKFPTTGDIPDTAASTNKSDRYIVKQGDTLATIALQFYGDTYAWTRIAEANNLLNPNDLRKDMILIIPR